MLLQTEGTAPMDTANMLWLIQRDFLEGQPVQQMLAAALQPVANPSNDADIEQARQSSCSINPLLHEFLVCMLLALPNAPRRVSWHSNSSLAMLDGYWKYF